MEDKYKVTIYVAEPGTPLQSGGTSDAGHIYYSISKGHNSESYGFAPITHGQFNGPGKVYDDNVEDYKTPYYARTMEITKDQYVKLQDFGKAPDKHNFDMEYHGAINSCIDFTWSALNHAGLHRNTLLGKDKDYEGVLKPLDNVRDIKRIDAPFPNSELNQERQNKMPERTLKRWFLSDQQQTTPPGASRDHANAHAQDPLIHQAEAAVRRLDAKTGREYDGQSARMTASVARLAKANGLSQIDHLLLSEERGAVRKGENLFVVQGDPGDPAHRRGMIKTREAINTPIEQSVAQLQVLNETQQRQPPAQAMGEPARETSAPQMRMG